MRLREWLDSTRGLPRREREILLQELAGISRADALVATDRAIDCSRLPALNTAAARLHAGEPLAYVLGHQDFWDLRLGVSPAVLIPRPETELLVELALERAQSGMTLLDLGTGSGAVALACASASSDLSVTAVDLSAEALAQARANAQRLRLAVEFRQSDWFERVRERFDLVVANPPYVAEGDAHLAALTWEPTNALVAGPEGLDHIRHIAARASTHLNPGGWLAVEHGFDQGPACRALLIQNGYVNVETAQDLAGHDRVTHGRTTADGG